MWFVTVMEKLEDDISFPVDVGDIQTWGFYSDKEQAVKSLHENWTDMHELSYDYAVIEEYDEGIGNYCCNRQWFKWDEDREGYFEIEEPRVVKHVVCFALG